MARATKFSDVSDMALIEITRSGENAAFTELWHRHERALKVAVQNFTNQDPDDVAQETFTRIYAQLMDGKGPTTAFRAYLLGAARNIANNMAVRGTGTEMTGFEEDTFDALSPSVPDSGERILGSEFTLGVFGSLPTRWQEVLWYREVEDLPVQEVAKYIGASPNATSVLIKRARAGFTTAWVAAHLTPGNNLPPECAWVLEQLPGFSQAKPSAATRKLTAHLSTCTRCAILSEEVNHLHKRLALVLLPALLGLSGSQAYRAWIQTGDSSPMSPSAASVAPTVAGSSTPAGAVAGLRAGAIVRHSLTPLALLSVSAVTIGLLTSAPFGAGSTSPPTNDAESRSSAQSSAEEPKREEAQPAKDDTESDRTGVQEQQEGAPLVEVTIPETREQPVVPEVPDVPDVPEVPEPPKVVPEPPKEVPEPPKEVPEDPQPIASTLTAVAADGVEVGVYPNMIGQGEPGATVTVTVSNELGVTRTATVIADNTGAWSYTPSQLRGQLSITAQQTFTRDGLTVREELADLGTFPVGDGLRMTITASGPNSSIVKANHFGPVDSSNQSLNLQSPTLGRILTAHRWTAPGEVEITLPYSRAQLDMVVFWQGDTSQGPRRYWTISGG